MESALTKHINTLKKQMGISHWLIVLVILLSSLALYAVYSMLSPNDQSAQHTEIKPISLSEKPTGGDFELQAADRTYSLSDFKNKLVLIYFGYTYCPDICPTNLAALSMAYQDLSKTEQDKVQLLFISVDPDRDTPERLADYVNYFNSKMIGLTGDKKYIAELSKRYGVIYQKVEGKTNKDYAVDHSAFTLVVNPQGQLVEQLPHASPVDKIKQTIYKYIN